MKYLKLYEENFDDSLETKLINAVGNKNNKRVSELISQGANINCLTEQDYTPIMLAACDNSLAIVKTLVEAGANTNIKNTFGNYPITMAAARGYSRALKELLKSKNININIRTDSTNSTALIIAARNINLDCIIELINADANWNITDDENKDFISILKDKNSEYLTYIIDKFPNQYKNYIKNKRLKSYNLNFNYLGFNENIQEDQNYNYVLIEFLRGEHKIYMFRTVDINNKFIFYDKYYFIVKQKSGDELFQRNVEKNAASIDAFNIIYVSDNEEKAIDKLKIYSKSNKYNLNFITENVTQFKKHLKLYEDIKEKNTYIIADWGEGWNFPERYFIIKTISITNTDVRYDKFWHFKNNKITEVSTVNTTAHLSDFKLLYKTNNENDALYKFKQILKIKNYNL